VEDHVPAERFPVAVEYAVLRLWADDVLDADPRLRTSRATDLDALVAEFRDADRRLVEAAAGAVLEACRARRPRSFAGGAAKVIARQAELKRRHLPVRELLSRTRDVVPAIKPCFMMSPLTVSQFLPSDYRFDVVVFDEASQVRPADAINCVYRAGSLIVAGDEKQLPPTSFFDSAVGDDGDEYDEDTPDSFESLLDACKAGALNVLPLRWHYRSRHEDLITFSNRSFYEGSLISFPGARDHGDDVGVAFFQAAGAVYDRGGRRDNRIEAELVARRVIHHFDHRPGRTLGVVALSQAQASAIEDALQRARDDRPDLDRFFTDDRLDGFFVKSLENVQGDERDVMILSVGYGPDETGRIRRTFGPVTREEGWRRLNVAVTRARYRTEAVASFPASALDAGDNTSLAHLKRYLDYAQNGPAVLAGDVRVDPDAEPESPFEESVLQVLRGWGYDVQPQVGVAGYRIDIGVRHPDLPGSFTLGVECDGAMYHSSKAARDRDRLREQILTGKGWKLHRIWGTDWYRNRAAAMDRLRTAVDRAVADGPVSAVAETPKPPVLVPHPVASEPEPVALNAEPERAWSTPYVPWQGEFLPIPTAELHTPEARPALWRLLPRAIETEGPVHEELLVQRVRELWGLARAGGRIRANIQHVLRGLGQAGQICKDGDFWDVPGRMCVTARRPSDRVRRPVGRIAPAERQVALRELAAECPGASGEELVRLASDFFGWARLGQDIRAALYQDITALFARGALTGGPDRITVA
jgi:very-short-patch-repair endonuclease